MFNRYCHRSHNVLIIFCFYVFGDYTLTNCDVRKHCMLPNKRQNCFEKLSLKKPTFYKELSVGCCTMKIISWYKGIWWITVGITQVRPCVGPSKNVRRFITLSDENYAEFLYSEEKNKRRGNILVILGWWKKEKRGLFKDVLTFKRSMRLDDPVIQDIFLFMVVSNQVTNLS